GEHRLEHVRRTPDRKALVEHDDRDEHDDEHADQSGHEVRDAGLVAPWALAAPHVFVAFVFSVCRPTLPGGLPISEPLPEYGSFPAAHSAVWPGESVFGYGVTWSGPGLSVVMESGFEYGFWEGTGSPPRTSSIATRVNWRVVPVATVSESKLAVLRRNSVT